MLTFSVLSLNIVVFFNICIHSCKGVGRELCALYNCSPLKPCLVNLMHCHLGCWLFVSSFPELPHAKADKYALDSPVDF